MERGDYDACTAVRKRKVEEKEEKKKMATMISELPGSHEIHHFHPASPFHQPGRSSVSSLRVTAPWPAATEFGEGTFTLPQQHLIRPSQQFVRPLRKPAPSGTAHTTPSFAQGRSLPTSSEHMLRRKTPSGTLAAGYDGSPVEWYTRPHASKYFLLPASSAQTPAAHPLGHNAGIPSLQTQSTYAASRDVQANQSMPTQTSLDRIHQNAGPIESLQFDSLWSPKCIPAAGFDSVLNQASPYNQQYRLAGEYQTQTALQPMWPPYLGSTYSQSLAPSGSFWSYGNANVEQYRQHSYQDARFQCQRHPAEPAPSPSRLDRLTFKNEGHSRERLESESVPLAHQENKVSTDRHGILHRPSGFTGGSELHKTRTENDKGNAGLQQGNILAYRSKERNWHERLEPNHQSAQQSSTRFQNFEPVWNGQSIHQRHGDSSGHAHFKEKVLAWAHRIYGALLAAIEHERRNPSREQQSSHIQPSLGPPPRRPYPSWTNGQYRNLASQNYISRGSQMSSHSTERPQTSGFSTNASTAFRDNTTVGRVERSHQLSGFSNTQTGKNWHSMHLWPNAGSAQASYVPAQFVQDQHQNTPASAAMSAIEVLGRLCEESRWSWTEGIILSGCLAYGLGNYDRALELFSKVLQHEPTNVEALSNLAAALMSIDRKQEAEQYWIQAVRIQPGYFDAVEGLVGLLHESQRAREAVKIVEYVEEALRDSRRSEAKGQSYRLLSYDNRYNDESLNLSGYQINSSDNGRLLALIHGKGNVLYQVGDNLGAAKAFEDAILVGAGRARQGIHGLIRDILTAFSDGSRKALVKMQAPFGADEPLLLAPDLALETSRLVFPPQGHLPGLERVSNAASHKAAVSIVSNSLLSLAKIYQDGMSSSGASATGPRATSGVQEILALYYLSLSLQPSPSTANNVGILLAGVQQSARSKSTADPEAAQSTSVPGVVAGSGVALALAYYDYGLKLDSRHAHLYTNLGSLFKDIGQLDAAIRMYEKAVDCDGSFDIALANLANAVKDKGDIRQAINYYKRAVHANPEFAEAVCGLANALNSVCRWNGRGGISPSQGVRDRWHVDENGVLHDSTVPGVSKSGWIERVVAIVEKQLSDGQNWGQRVLQSVGIDTLLIQLDRALKHRKDHSQASTLLTKALQSWSGEPWEGAKVVRLVERATKRLSWQMYRDKYVDRRPERGLICARPQLPAALAVPGAPTVLPFHTFTCPLSASQIRKISQRNGLRVSCSTLRAPWLPSHIFEPPPPPRNQLHVGYVSSDFNNHPLAHLMQSVFGLHDRNRVKAFCYATTASDSSVHRQQIEREAPVFYDASSWSIDRLVNQIVGDGIHILVNLNGYTRGAKNEVFAARPAPIQMSFMGFAGTLGAEWCDYLLADKIAVPPQTLRPWRGNVDIVDQTQDGNFEDGPQDDWVYGENIIFAKDTFFCCDHRQSAPDAHEGRLSWAEEQRRRWKMRKELFPELADDAIILGNFNQLYKVCNLPSSRTVPSRVER